MTEQNQLIKNKWNKEIELNLPQQVNTQMTKNTNKRREAHYRQAAALNTYLNSS